MNKIEKIIQFLSHNSWADAQILELLYDNNNLNLKIENYKGEIFTFMFENIYQLSFQNYLNDDISEIKYSFSIEDKDDVCKVSIISASTDNEILSFSFFVDSY